MLLAAPIARPTTQLVEGNVSAASACSALQVVSPMRGGSVHIRHFNPAVYALP
jgi:hypothetical protein